jgi:hypothetical protein
MNNISNKLVIMVKFGNYFPQFFQLLSFPKEFKGGMSFLSTAFFGTLLIAIITPNLGDVGN